MRNFLKNFYGILFDYDAVGRLRIFATGWIAIVSILGLVVVVGVSLLRLAFVSTDIVPLGTPLPPTATRPVPWTVIPAVQPNGTKGYVVPRDVRNSAADAFVEAWTFMNAKVDPGDETLVAQQMNYFVLGSQAEKWAKSVIDGAKLTGSYWRQKIAGPFNLSNVAFASADGQDVSFVFAVPQASMSRELIDLKSGAVIMSQPRELVVSVTMHYSADKRWRMLVIKLP